MKTMLMTGMKTELNLSNLIHTHMVSTNYLHSRRADALKLQSIIENGATHNYEEIDLSIIKSASLSPNGFAYVNGTCMVICKKPKSSGHFIHHYAILEL